jgi:hypothetical protein
LYGPGDGLTIRKSAYGLTKDTINRVTSLGERARRCARAK